ncbi:hypothetical protein TI04_09480, partial [Achromatium sp. WMS2]
GELWLGQQSNIAIVTNDANGVFLIVENQDGRQPVLLGINLTTAIDNANLDSMFKLHGLLHVKLLAIGYTAIALRHLLETRSTELETQHGLTSPEYQRWCKIRSQLSTLVN